MQYCWFLLSSLLFFISKLCTHECAYIFLLVNYSKTSNWEHNEILNNLLKVHDWYVMCSGFGYRSEVFCKVFQYCSHFWLNTVCGSVSIQWMFHQYSFAVLEVWLKTTWTGAVTTVTFWHVCVVFTIVITGIPRIMLNIKYHFCYLYIVIYVR